MVKSVEWWRWLDGCNCWRRDTRWGEEWALRCKLESTQVLKSFKFERDLKSVKLECSYCLVVDLCVSFGVAGPGIFGRFGVVPCLPDLIKFPRSCGVPI